MTVTATPRRRRSRRWVRAAIPFAALIVIWLWIGVAHAIEEPDLDEPGTLSPTGTGPHGSSRLADLLRSRGIQVDRVTSATLARQAATGSDGTVFVPTPDYLDPDFFTEIAATARRVVVVQPSLRTVLLAGLPAYPTGDVWATTVVDPACSAAVARAGRAAAFNTRYEFDGSSGSARQSMNCYSGGVVGVIDDGTEIVYIGANDPFRNDRIDEVGNATLAITLLSQSARVIWVDVHTREPQPPPANPQLTLPQYRRDNQDRTNTGFPLFDAFPSWLWAGLSLAVVGAVLFAVAHARRLGPPVAEPLPVVVPGSETITGRGRLYQRINARDATLEALRGAAIGRMVRVVNPFGGQPHDRDLARGTTGADRLVRQIADHTGTPEARSVGNPLRPAAGRRRRTRAGGR